MKPGQRRGGSNRRNTAYDCWWINEWDAGDDPGPIPPRAANPRYRLGKELTLKAGDLNPPWGPLGERPGENTRRATVQNLLEGGNGAVTPALNASDGVPIQSPIKIVCCPTYAL